MLTQGEKGIHIHRMVEGIGDSNIRGQRNRYTVYRKVGRQHVHVGWAERNGRDRNIDR